MRPLLFPTQDLSKEEVDLITEVYNTLKPSYREAAFDFDFQPQLSNFESITGYYTNIDFGPVLRLGDSGPRRYLCFLKLIYRGVEGKYNSRIFTDCQFWDVS